ncbi:beta-N-acetylhexosaminidase [soil metagenome]
MKAESLTPEASTAKVSLLPYPLFYRETGDALVLSPERRVYARERDRATAELLAARLRRGTGWPWVVVNGVPEEGDAGVVFREEATGAAESYRLSTLGSSVEISAGDAAGAFYGSQTLLQLLPTEIFGEVPQAEAQWAVPVVEIADEPRFRWRGVMLDSSRHFQPVAYLKKFIDGLSQHKINVLHWHLTDDQGWRIEIKRYPKLTEIGSRRRETWVGHALKGTGCDGVPVEGVYTQEEIRELVAYAAERHVQILPEIEMPGHAQAAIAAYPELGCVAQAPEVSCQWGVHEYLFNIEPATMEFLRGVLEEVIELFPFKYVHLGGDEAVKAQWKAHMPTQRRMAALGVRDEEALQGWFLGQMAEFLKSRGKTVVGWDEILEAELPAGATIMSWRGSEGALVSAQRGHHTIMCAHTAYYFDYGQSTTPEQEPLHICGETTLQKVYEHDPVPEGLLPSQTKNLIGIQGQLWTEYIPTTEHLEYMAYPRVCALAERAWSEAGQREFADFERRLEMHLKRLKALEIGHRRLEE